MRGYLWLLLWLPAGTLWAAPLTYTPVNPSFGGNPLNGSVLLGEAQAINKYTAPVVTKSPADKLQAFADSLQSAILSRVSSAALRNIINVDGGLIPGTVETQDYIITVTDKGNGVTTISTTDRTTGQTNTFEISTQL
ncbi:curli production assembly/transport component CsgF [Solimonas aquatica]|uniref:Curli production assembly/transport component CsgF n=1 Tax=Solimonas aquatica TaxID=489703 RepID=A0A1H9DLP4_9GAMM|nr:curli assembly protein CsgF [Solimonas aquatica]SEQ14384.1 curli production assembly/transport component CsgF [Solimonas aquatica]